MKNKVWFMKKGISGLGAFEYQFWSHWFSSCCNFHFFLVFGQYSTRLSIVNRNVHDSRLLHFCTRSDFFFYEFLTVKISCGALVHICTMIFPPIFQDRAVPKSCQTTTFRMVKYVFSFTYLWALITVFFGHWKWL